MGSFLSATDMQSGSPGFGGPESALGLYASGQIARRLGPPVAIGRRHAHVQPDGGLPGRVRGVQHAQRRVPGGSKCVLAVGRLAGGRPGDVVREVRRRLRAARPADPPVHSGRGGRGQPGLRRARRGRPRAATSSARRTRSSGSATASGAQPWRRPRTTTAGRATARSTMPRAPARRWERDARDLRAAAARRGDRGGAGRVRRDAAPPSWAIRWTCARVVSVTL